MCDSPKWRGNDGCLVNPLQPPAGESDACYRWYLIDSGSTKTEGGITRRYYFLLNGAGNSGMLRNLGNVKLGATGHTEISNSARSGRPLPWNDLDCTWAIAYNDAEVDGTADTQYARNRGLDCYTILPFNTVSTELPQCA
jgi:hypothetical protein